LEDINVHETINGMIQGIYKVQSELIKEGKKDIRLLKCRDEDMSPGVETR